MRRASTPPPIASQTAGLERYFPDRPDISNMGPLAQYDAFLILITQPVTCTMPVTAASGSTRTLQWGAGWNNAGWSGADGTPPQQAFACADGSYAAAYRFVDAGLERYFPGRPDISNMGPLNKYDAFLSPGDRARELRDAHCAVARWPGRVWRSVEMGNTTEEQEQAWEQLATEVGGELITRKERGRRFLGRHLQLAVVGKAGTSPIALDVRVEYGGEYAPNSLVTRIRAPYVARDAFSFSVKRVRARLSDGAVLHGMARLAGRHKVEPGDLGFERDFLITANDTRRFGHCLRIQGFCGLIQSQPSIDILRPHAPAGACSREVASRSP